MRYDAVLGDSRSHRLKVIYRLLFLPWFFACCPYLGYTGRQTARFLLTYRARRRQLVPFPYVIDGAWIQEGVEKYRQDRKGLRRSMGFDESTFVIVVVAKFIPREAPLDLLRALARRTGLSRRIGCIIVGDGPMKQVVHAAAGKAGHVTFIFPGYVPYGDLLKYYAAADVFVHGVAEEVWGVSVNEALAAGLPVVASDRVGAAREILTGRNCGLLYEYGDDEKLAEILEALWDGEMDMGQLSANARKAAERYTGKTVGDRLIYLTSCAS